MKKAIFFTGIFFILTGVLLLSGCSKSQDNTSAVNNTSRLNRRPDFGQPERQADVNGLVKSVTGSEVTILKMDRAQRDTAADSEAGTEGSTDSGQRPANLGATLNGGTTGGPAGGGRRMGGFGNGGPPDEWDEDSRTAMLEQIKAMSSGEETVTIPVGIQMLKPDTTAGSGQPEMLEATLADITADKMIQVWLDESVADRKIASFVLITM